MESDDQSNIPTKAAIPGGSGEPRPAERVTDSQVGKLLGAGSRRDQSGEWQPPSPEELQHDFLQHEMRGILGRGGMGAVYKAWQKSLDRFVAIKILPPGIDDGISDFTERFKREAKAMAHLKHPGIVAVYDAGETPRGLRYFIMECIDGTDVQRLLAERGRIEPAEALRITGHVCNALGYAHAHGVIHRDIKPSNIMIETDGDVKVADFGLAKSTDAATTLLTLSNVTMGTLEYMAPEATTSAANADHRADLYSVGVMLYQMLTGKLPRGKFASPSSIVPGLDRRLDKIVDRALQPKPDARFQSAREMTDAVEPILRSAGRRTVVGGAAVGSRRRPVLIGIAAAVVVGCVASLGYFQPWKSGRDVPNVPPVSDRGTRASRVQPRAATKAAPFVNFLGQEFVPVPGTGVLFCKWETRVQDYVEFTRQKKVSEAWRSQDKEGLPVSAEPGYPVCAVSWKDATAFCHWLTEKEAADGRLPAGMRYRLPTDEEWSRAVGMPKEDGATPKERHKKNDTHFPWGTEFPPPEKIGNYADSAYHARLPKQNWIEGYTDGFPATSPVGRFPPDPNGLYDMSGNLWEWCEDIYEPGKADCTLRGASWLNYERSTLLSSYRYHYSPEKGNRDLGFRVVLDLGGK